MDFDDFIILVPALDPPDTLIILLSKLCAKGFRRIMIADDGSKPECTQTFAAAQALGVRLVHLSEHMGKGAALRAALQSSEQDLGNAEFYITADCDGQHTADDVEMVARELLRHPDHLVIGVRKFEKKNGKRTSYYINSAQKIFFRTTNHGKVCSDPRSGLRGFPAKLKELALQTEGDSYDYEMNFLEAAIAENPVSEVPISTETFTKDTTSHFRPVWDLLGLYRKFWRYMATSNISTVFDLVLFCIFDALFNSLGAASIFAATVCARILSGFVGYLLNRFISFRSKLSPGMEMIRYFVVFIGQMAASGILVTILEIVPIPTVLVKAVVDFFLFFAGYNLQKTWVFGNRNERTKKYSNG